MCYYAKVIFGRLYHTLEMMVAFKTHIYGKED
jgi:hypothetical protein